MAEIMLDAGRERGLGLCTNLDDIGRDSGLGHEHYVYRLTIYH